jgi:elongation factor P
MQIPCVERPPGTPSIERQGQIGSQLHASRYVPDISHGSWSPIDRGYRRDSVPSAAVISTNQFKNGTHVEVDGTIYKILDFQHVKPGKGGAFVRTKLRKVDDGSVQDKTFRAGEKFRPVRTETRKMQYLYDSGDSIVLMDTSSYDQLEIPRDVAGDEMRWVTPNDNVDVLFVDERVAGVQVPSAVDMAVTQTDPGLKGDTASGGGSKPATLESGVTIQVPLFVNEGDRVRVDTRSGEYVSRA